MDNHIVKEWDSNTHLYTCVCGYQSKDNIKVPSLSGVTCLNCLIITIKNQVVVIEKMKKLAHTITKL